MAFRIHESVVRGEIDNREKGIVRGRIWVHGRAEPVVLELLGNAHPDLAGCLLAFDNPLPTTPHPHLASLDPRQTGTIGDLTASRKVRVFDLPIEEAYAMLKRGEKPPEHMANSLYLEWYSEANGRVVIESADYQVQISPPAWTLTPKEEAERAQEAASGFERFMGQLSEALDDARFKTPQDRPMNEFEWEKAFRESDALTDKAMELHEKYGDDPDFEQILAREMGWKSGEEDGVEEDGVEDEDEDEDEQKTRDGNGEGRDEGGGAWDVDEMNRICAEAAATPAQPNPLTEGVDWVREKDGDISHPLELRIRKGAVELWRWCDERGLLGENGDPDVHEMVFKYQCCGAKCAGALGGLAYEDDAREPGFIVARLKRALALLHEALAAADRAASKQACPAEKLDEFRKELFEVREEILALMQRFRGEADSSSG